VKTSLSIPHLGLAAALVLTVAATAKDAPKAPATAGSPAKVASLHFLAGHWEGHVDTTRIEQTCSVSDPAVMICMFQLTGDNGTEMIEFYTIRDTPDGVEERIRFYSPDLKEGPGDGVTMKLASSTPTTFVFENPTGTYPKRSTLTRTGEDEFHSHIELVNNQGKTSFIDAYWKKTK
jgi:hypothetical protein